jgi:malate dehydrogenase (oxaloacetate-decarboxylating)(NADP+)
LDVSASVINEHKKAAAVNAIAALAKETVPSEVLKGYGLEALSFGPEYIIPKPTDGRLLGQLSMAVAQAAIDSGVARLPMPANYPLNSIEDC